MSPTENRKNRLKDGTRVPNYTTIGQDGGLITPCDGAIGVVPLTITIATARQITGLGNTTIWKLIGEKKLQTVCIGRRRLVLYDSLRALLAPAPDAPPQARRRGRPRKSPASGAGL
jgi:hypothetical protein